MNKVVINSSEILDKLNQLSNKVYEKDVSQLSDAQRRDLVSLDIGMMATELTASASETRTTEVKFNTNVYMGSCKIDMHGAVEYVTEVLRQTPDDKLLERYFDLKSSLLKMYRIKWEGHEHFIRSLLRAAQEKDGILGLGRYKQ